MKPLVLFLIGLLLSSGGLLPASEPDPPLLLFNEVMAHPLPGEEEWIELYNAGPEVDLEGFTLTDQDSHTYTFPALSLPPGAYLVLLVQGLHPDEEGVLAMGFSRSILNDDGDDLLLSGNGHLLDFFSYGAGSGVDAPPPSSDWEGSAIPAPQGQSMALDPDGLVEDDPQDWRASFPTPGRSNTGDSTPSGVLLSEVYYHAYRDDEYVGLRNRGSLPVNLSGWSLTDGEGTWRLPELPPLPPGELLRISHNATALLWEAGLPSAACVRGCLRLVARQGSLLLANHGDAVVLLDRYGRPVDAFYYGDATPGPGWGGAAASPLPRGYVAKRRADLGGPLDTDSAEDWSWNRTFRLGQSARSIPSFVDVPAAPLLSPDNALPRLLALLDGAKGSIFLGGFSLSHPDIGAALHRALRRGVSLHLGLEGNPPGGLGERERDLRDGLGRAGAHLLEMGPSPDTGFRRYAFHHAKYLVVDHRWLILGSENFSENGYSGNGTGNRGWGVLLEHPGLASWFEELFRADFNPGRSDISVRSVPTHGAPEELSPDPKDAERTLPYRADLEVLVSPDNAVTPAGLLRVLDGATSTLDVAIFYVRWDWRGGENPLVQGLLRAANRGVRVRLLLDGSGHNVWDAADNDESVRALNALARAANWPLEARLFPPGSGFVKLHNKGLLADGTTTLLSSINWNYHGAYENREAGVLLHSRTLTQFYAEAFEADWERAVQPPSLAIRGPLTLRVGETGEFQVGAEGFSGRAYAWDLGADGQVDGTGERFLFHPAAAGTVLLQVAVTDVLGVRHEIEARVVVLPAELPQPTGVLVALLAIAAGTGALLWLRSLRTTREPTNNDGPHVEDREVGEPDLRRRD